MPVLYQTLHDGIFNCRSPQLVQIPVLSLDSTVSSWYITISFSLPFGKQLAHPKVHKVVYEYVEQYTSPYTSCIGHQNFFKSLTGRASLHELQSCSASDFQAKYCSSVGANFSVKSFIARSAIKRQCRRHSESVRIDPQRSLLCF